MKADACTFFFFYLFLNRIRLNSRKFTITRTKPDARKAIRLKDSMSHSHADPKVSPLHKHDTWKKKIFREVGKKRSLVGLFHTSSVVGEVVQHDQAVHEVP